MRSKLYNPLVYLFTLLSCSSSLMAQCDFSVSSNINCGESLVDFQVDSPAGGSYTWDFQSDGNIDASGTTVSYIFPASTFDRAYTVTLYYNNTPCETANITILSAPDASLGVVPGSGVMNGNQIRVCSALPDVTLSIFNASTSYTRNASYLIDWGDGSSETHTNATFSNSGSIDHDYTQYGYYTIDLTVTGQNGCVSTESYTFYNGSNPSVGLANPGNTVGLCVPATITFPITNTANNPEGTEYFVYVNGQVVDSFNQSNIPPSYTYLFLDSSCGETTSTGNYQNAFDVQIVATNPCGSSQATIEPIELSEPPEPIFEINRPTVGCEEEVFTITNTSTAQEVISGNPSNCSTNLAPTWSITPGVSGVDWVVLSGNLFNAQEIQIQFLTPGTYTVQMIIHSDACGDFTFAEEFLILELADAEATASLVTASFPAVANECAPTLGTFINNSTGDSVTYSWIINPPSGWSFVDTTNLSTEHLNVSFDEAGSYTVFLTTSNFCSSDTWDTTLVIAGEPSINILPLPDSCLSATLNFNPSNVFYNANGGAFNNFTWSFPGGTPSSSNDQFPSNIHYSNPGTYTITLSASNQCGTTTTTTTLNIQDPGILQISNDTIVCAFSTPFQLGSNYPGGIWEGNGVAAGGLFTPDASNIGSNTIRYSVMDGVCPLTDSLVITVIAAPMVEAGPDEEVCEDEMAYQLSGFNPVGGNWSIDNGGIITGNEFDPIASGPGTYTLTYTFSDINGCNNFDQKTITVHVLPNVDAGPDQSICENPNDIPLTGFSPSGGSWSGPGVTAGGVFNAANTAGIGTYTLYYHYTDPATSCSNLDSLQITVISNEVADAGPDEEVCLNAPSFVLSSGTPTGGSWSGNGVEPFSGLFDPAAAGVGVHVLTYTTGTGYCQTSNTKIIIVQALPDLTVPADRAICLNEAPLNLNAVPTGGSWSGIGISGNTFDPGIAGEGLFTLTYTYTDPLSGCSNTASMRVEVYPLPVLQLRDTLYCNTPGLVDLPRAEPSGGAWSGPGIVGNQFEPQIAGGAGSYRIAYQYADANGCSNTDTMTIQVIDPAAVNAGADQIVCIDAPLIDLSQQATPTGGSWSANGSAGLNNSIFDPAVAGVGVHILTYEVGTGNCRVSDNAIIDIRPLPIVEAGQNIALCQDAPLTTLAGFSPSGGVWSGPGITDQANGTIDASLLSPGDYQLTYVYTDLNGCTDQDELTLTIHPLPIVDAGNDTLFCNNPVNVYLNDPSPLGGTWSGPGIVGPAAGAFNPQAAGGVGQYTLFYTYADPITGCINVDSLVATIIEPIVLEAGPDDTICISNGLYTLSGQTAVAGVWSGRGIEDPVTGIFNPELAGVGAHILTYTFGVGSCEVQDFRTIIVRPLPTVEAGLSRVLCADAAPLQLTGFSPVGGEWNGPGITDPIVGVFDPALLPAGDHQLYYRYTDGFGCFEQDSLTITIYPLPEVNAGNDTTFCDAAIDVTLNSPSPAGGTWSGPGIVSAYAGTFNPQQAGGEGQYTLIYTYVHPTTNCVNLDSLTVTVLAPSPIEAGPNDTICIDQGILQLSGQSALAGTWTGRGIVDPILGTFDPMIAGGGTHTLFFTYGVGSCLVRDFKTVRVVDLRYVDAGPNETLCFNNEPITLGGYIPAGGVWSGPGITDPYVGIFDPATAEVGQHTLTYTYTDPESGCISSSDKFITVFPMEQPDFLLPEVACRNELVSFTNLSPIQYDMDWDFGNGRGSNAINPEHAYFNAGSYVITLTVTNEFGCVDSVKHTIVITDKPIAYFVPDTTEACSGIDLELINQSSGYGLSHDWQLGNGLQSNEADPGVVFYGQGIRDTTYIITLTVSNLCGSSTYQDLITVRPLPQAGFGFSPESDCSPIVINFANNSIGGATDYFWDFGNGNTSNEIVPDPQTYTTDSLTSYYDVTLIASNVCGSDTLTEQIVIAPSDVQAFFEVSDDKGCMPFTVDFYNVATPGANIHWDFGDGNTSSSLSPTHTFDSAGVYTVIQYASSDCGFDSTSLLITVLPQPIVSFEHEREVCFGRDVQFINQSTEISGNHWDFGDGDTSLLSNPTHVYARPGTYAVTLTSSSLFNQCPSSFTSEVTVLDPPQADFEPSTFSGCVPLAVDFENRSIGATYYTWDFGNGNTGTGVNPTHVYDEVGRYDVSVVARDIYGCTDDTTQFNILVNPTPSAGFEFEEDALCQLPSVVVFNNTSEGAQSYDWTFGDGDSSTYNNPNHIYTEGGDYRIRLIATNQFSCADTSISDITIYPSPIADFEVETQEGCSPVEVLFNNVSADANLFEWDFGDGHTSNAEHPLHVYDSAGWYAVKLVASVDGVCYDSIELSRVVQVHPSPMASFAPEEIIVNGLSTGTYDFLNLSIDADTYFWDFGDGATSEVENPRHRYDHSGNYQIYLEASNIHGCADDTLINITPELIKGLFLPNALSPETGIGDVRVFRPAGIGLKEYKCQVFSPYGQLLWESQEIDEEGRPTEAWDGTFQGKLLPQDVYVWKAFGIFLDGTTWRGERTETGDYKTMGSVILLR